MSESPSPRIFAGICIIIMLPILFVISIFQFLGIGDIVFPILLPIFAGVFIFVFFIMIMIMFAVRCVSKADPTAKWTRREYTTYTHGARSTVTRPVYQIPMNCPSCQREIELDLVEWRDRLTVVCPGCFADIQVESSHER